MDEILVISKNVSDSVLVLGNRSHPGHVKVSPEHKGQDSNQPSHRANSTLATVPSESLDRHATDSSPQHDLETVENEVGLEACPALEPGDVFGEELVCDDDEALGRLRM